MWVSVSVFCFFVLGNDLVFRRKNQIFDTRVSNVHTVGVFNPSTRLCRREGSHWMTFLH